MDASDVNANVVLKVWRWLRWVLLAGIIIFLLIWGVPRLIALAEKPIDEARSEPNQEISNLLATVVANQENINSRLNKLEATPAPQPKVEEPKVEEPEVEEPEVEEPEVEEPVVPTTEAVVSNSLVNPELFDADTQPVGDDEGYFDIGVNPGQVGIVFGWDLSWGENSIVGEGCEIVILSGGWYEDFRIVDGRYEVYTLPDIDGWTQVLIDQRVAEQAAHYGCPADAIPPIWEGGE